MSTHFAYVGQLDRTMLSIHAATLALVEALLVGGTTEQPKETLANLESVKKYAPS